MRPVNVYTSIGNSFHGTIRNADRIPHTSMQVVEPKGPWPGRPWRPFDTPSTGVYRPTQKCLPHGRWRGKIVREFALLKREEWLHLARKLDWQYSYVREEEVFPEIISGTPWLPHSSWKAGKRPSRLRTANTLRTNTIRTWPSTQFAMQSVVWKTSRI